MAHKSLYYYRIYDDKEEFNFFKSSFEEKKIREQLKEYERLHDQYINPDFVMFLREHDPEAELIDMNTITY